MKKYISFAKERVFPKLTQESQELLARYYVQDRKAMLKSKVPVTVRQLEAIISLSGALAKMQLSDYVYPFHVEEAHRIFTVSTMSVHT